MRLIWAYVRMAFIAIKNVIVFLSVVIPKGIPIYKWPIAWQLAQAAHEREIRDMLTELTMKGEVKRRIVDGEFVYYPPDWDEDGAA